MGGLMRGVANDEGGKGSLIVTEELYFDPFGEGWHLSFVSALS